ncbi:MAG TPA: NAD-dependent epimerase/dehydratase family protein [Gemmataceae bacterium]|jgi:nucleoside-diphosphate-sugar epimerase|nr:NAD-dependent epimerase/dehydratase family protein [Gemmataceae bacterium]
MRVLVIGGTRFIGPCLIHRLAAAGHEVAVFHRGRTNAALPAGVRTLLGDRHRLADHAGEFRRFGPDVVVDMIPFTEQDARSAVATFRGMAGRLVALSSGDVYRAYGVFTRLEPGPPEPTPVKEDGPLRQALFPYRAGATPGDAKFDYEKILVERAVLGDTGLPATVLRLPMVYGPGDDQHRLAPYLRRMLDGRPAVLLDGGLARWRCLRGYVEDVAAAVALAVTSPAAAGRVYNVAEPTAHTEAEWVARVGAAAGWGGEVVAVPGGRLPVPFNTAQDLVVDTARIRAELGYREVVDPDDALRETVAWERGHLPEVPVDYAQEDGLLAGLRAKP